ncbi:hypothetical protein AWC29_00070 [Mycobacterium triplex]|uniref:Uncharacterized protein n=1 Tax=Mycobacterium triplex TaxID=47839 RepID=A0ABX3WAI0_9MYCO|nr:hypothetical protein AWC29_00070 [Mycobacterium triplex]
MHSCHDGLKELRLDTNTAEPLTKKITEAIARAERLAVVVEGDLRADEAVGAARRRHPAGRAL